MLMVGDHIDALLERPYDEASALDSDLHVAVGHELMEYFLFGSRMRRHHD
jgi:hypothetical protein